MEMQLHLVLFVYFKLIVIVSSVYDNGTAKF